MAAYFSHSDNFVNSVSSNVDPRTGMFTCTATLGHSSENIFRGPKLPLMIGYAPFQSENFGLGTGWTFNFSSYDSASGVLNCMNGENYTVQQNGQQYSLNQAKLTSLKLSSDASWYRVDHGDGTIEILKGPGDAHTVKVPVTIYAPGGAAFNLDWQEDRNNPDRLLISAIRDNNNVKVLSATYSPTGFTLTLWPGSASQVVYAGAIAMDQLRSLTATGKDAGGKPQSWAWTFGYDTSPSQGPVLNQVAYPLGMVEQVVYRISGHDFPNGGPGTPLPYVSSFTRTAHGGGPVETFDYAFSTKNFLGGGDGHFGSASPLYNPAMDNLYAHTGESPPYAYTSTVTHKNGAATPVVTTRTYDVFHRLVSEIEAYEKNTSRQRVTDYYGNSLNDFTSQPNNYQLPRSVTTTYAAPRGPDGTGGKRAETTTFAYDAQDGVRTMMQTPDGVITDYVYYDARNNQTTTTDGFTYACPDSLSGRKRHVKTITITYPATRDSAGNPLDARTELHEFAWDKIPIPGGGQTSGPAPYAVVPTNVRSSTLDHGKTIADGVKTKLRLLTIAYVTTGADLGRISNVTEQLPDEHGAFRDVAALAMTYDTTADTFTETMAFTGHAGTTATATASRSFCVRTGQVTRSVSELGVATTRVYDWLGRIQTLTAAEGSPYAHITSCAYTLAKRGADAVATLSATLDDNAGRKARLALDGAGRLIAIDRGNGAPGGADQWLNVANASYDALGRPDTATILDYVAGTTAPTSASSGSFGYDSWTLNNLRQVTAGPWSRDDFDPVALKGVASWTRNVDPGNAGRAVTAYDTLQTPFSVTRITASGRTDGASAMSHDGRKRLRLHADEAGNITRASHDDWNRPTTLNLADSTRVDVAYDTAFTKALPTAISINSATVATRTHDGLGRVTSQTWGNQAATWSYDGAATRPASHAIAGGNTVDCTYVSELGEAVRSRTVRKGSLSHAFTYYDNDDPAKNPAGRLRTATQTDKNDPGNCSTITRTYDAWGLLSSEQITMAGKDLGTASWTYTAIGRPRTYTDPTGRTYTFAYDANGRLKTASNGSLRSGGSTIAYVHDDASGRITGWSVSKGGAALATATIAYDDFGRETYRTIAIAGGDALTITGGDSIANASQKYGPNSLVAKTSVLLNKSVVQQNTYAYDKRLRLSRVVCAGAHPPATRDGTPIAAIAYAYDACNNITAITRSPALGDAEITSCGYDAANPFVLNTLDGQTVTSDAAGAITAMGRRVFTHDGFGRLASVAENGVAIATYRYDALNRLICQIPAEGDPRYFFYAGDALAAIVDAADGDIAGGEATSWLHAAGGAAIEEGPLGTTIIAADAAGTVTGWAPPATRTFTTIPYEPYGAAPPNLPASAPLLGYNGQYRDAATGLQHLGNGYRPYDPAIGRFIAPDSESPFGKGGHNPFAYCDNDPVNFNDPTGQAKWWKVLLWSVVTVAAAVATVAAVAAIATTGIGLGLVAGVVAATSFTIWGATGIADQFLDDGAASYDTPSSGSAANGDAKAANTVHEIHKWSFLVGLGGLFGSRGGSAADTGSAASTAGSAATAPHALMAAAPTTPASPQDQTLASPRPASRAPPTTLADAHQPGPVRA
ncbi:sugar-binding protein [Camelimonas fluminis]|uniref:RHS repeat-associated core domain-containing protein n=1 Tax=Camelimonas fluminis TaxID=1576911 RepID=A0ABV7UJP6_9HYPH|nr:RHS repeat-associated core domain-containing protein [Camelimonas fluminis]GHE53372.1 sugar-binding protein [Camelimonas fluminis]